MDERQELSDRGFLPLDFSVHVLSEYLLPSIQSESVRGYSSTRLNETVYVVLTNQCSLELTLNLVDCVNDAWKLPYKHRIVIWEYLNNVFSIPCIRIAFRLDLFAVLADSLRSFPLYLPVTMIVTAEILSPLSVDVLFLAGALGALFVYLYWCWMIYPQSSAEFEEFRKVSEKLISVLDKLA